MNRNTFRLKFIYLLEENENMNVYDYILALLHVAREEKAQVTATKLQKIFFILEKEKNINLRFRL